MTDRPEDDEHDDREEDEEEESPPPPKAKPKASAKSSVPAGKAAPKPNLVPSSTALAIGVIALVVGGAAGWFGQIQKTKAALRAELAAPAGSGAPSGPCGVWQTKICASSGQQSASCQQAHAATDLLLPSTCDAALAALPETLAKIKAGRASCDKLVAKLCADLPPGSKTCDMVKDRTPSFPRERCDEMLGSYDKVIGQLKQMDAQGGPGGPQMGGPQSGAPHMAMPGGMPHITMPPGSTPPASTPPKP
jgi:hypothetical protein